jgi:hypothetical protein
MPLKKNTRRKGNEKVVSAFVFDRQQEDTSAPEGSNSIEKARQPITASVFINEESDLAFKTRLQNIIQYTFECILDHLAHQTPITAILRRSVDAMLLLGNETDRRLDADTSKRYHEIIEEITAFMHEDTEAPTQIDDMQCVLHYRHYVRIAWNSHFILENLKKFGQ